MSPLALQSRGIGITLSTNSWSVGNKTLAGRQGMTGFGLGFADMVTI
jgi:hypothetical protein